MFGIDISQTILDSCKEAGGRGYIVNNVGKLAFSSTKTPESISILEIDPNSDLSISTANREEMNENNLALTIVGKDKDHSKSFLPDRYFENVSYENRIYIYGMLDCYTLLRDYYRDTLGVWIPSNIDRSFGWWHNGRNLYVDMYGQYGFKEVTGDKIKIGDALIFKFDRGMPSHSAIYIGNGKMLHHMIGRMSCVEDFDGIYKVSLVGVLRYNGNVE